MGNDAVTSRGGETVRIWTIQEERLLGSLERRGYLTSSFERVDPDFLRAYRWVARRMLDAGVSRANKCPLWAWRSYHGRQHRKPDLRMSMHLPRGTRGVRIELEVTASQMLLSQFEMWVWILGGRFVPKNAREWEEKERLRRAGRLTQESVRQSWERIFDLRFGDEGFWGPFEHRGIQACLPTLRLSDIRRIDRFVAR